MCRFVAYIGSAVTLGSIIADPEHSLIEQSQNATEAKLAVNGDGFGVAWYGDDDEPGIYREILPAWSDGNLLSLCRMIKAQVFLAHVRASTIGETSRANCHPFSHGKWSFVHNGQIAEFPVIRRRLEAQLPDELYNARRGNTDSELLFLLALANGLEDNLEAALRKTMDQIEGAQSKHGLQNRVCCCLSDGESIFGFRYSSDGKSPTLYHYKDPESGGEILASEPLSSRVDGWNMVEDGAFVQLNGRMLYPTIGASVEPVGGIQTQVLVVH